MEEIMNDSDCTYEVMIKEIYHAGVYLVKNKYLIHPSRLHVFLRRA